MEGLEVLFEESIEALSAGHPEDIGGSLFGLAQVLRRRGDLTRAKATLSGSIQYIWDSGTLRLLFPTLNMLADILAEEGERRKTATLLGGLRAAEQWVELSSYFREEEQSRDGGPGRTGLDEEPIRAAWERGRLMTIEQVVALATDSNLMPNLES